MGDDASACAAPGAGGHRGRTARADRRPDRRVRRGLDGPFPGADTGDRSAQNTAGVAAVLAQCTDAGLPVVPQGGNSGLVGGGVPLHGEVVLSLTRLNQLGPVDQEASQVTAGAGVTLQQVADADPGWSKTTPGTPTRRCSPGRRAPWP